MQVVLVDDGSPDGCGRLCDEWAARDGRVEAVHRPNGGLSAARNTGLLHARGRLVTFVDADDSLAPDTYREVLSAMHDDTDLIEYPILRHYGSERQALLSFSPATYHGKRDYWYGTRAYLHTYACNKIYRRRLFEEVRFPEGRVFEDAATLPPVLDRCRKVQTTDRGAYCYADNPQGITANATGRQLSELLSAHLRHWDVTEDEAFYLHVLNVQLSVSLLTGNPPLLPTRRIRHLRRLRGAELIKAVGLNLLGVRGLCRLYRAVWGLGRHRR